MQLLVKAQADVNRTLTDGGAWAPLMVGVVVVVVVENVCGCVDVWMCEYVNM